MSSLLGAARTMAVGTVASRATGFLRTAVLLYVLGVASVGTAFNVANTAPNIIYELLLGGVLTSVLVPLLVRAAASDDDGGTASAQRLLGLVVLVLGAAAVALVALAPVLVDLYLGADVDEATRDLAVVLARFFLPQVLFYGVGAVLGAWLNTRGRFGAPMWAPVLNNVVVIATGLVFLLLPGPDALEAGTITDTQTAVLGVGVTLGIVAQSLALLPAVRSTGLPLRLRRDLRALGLRRVGSLAKWTLLYVAANQVAYLVVVRLASGAPEGRGYPSYVAAFALFLLPHAVVAVSVITALLPRMSRAAAADDDTALRAQLGQGLRLTLVVLVPAALGAVVLGQPLAAAVFGHGATTVDQARFVGQLLGVFALGLVPFSCYQLMLRAFYARQENRTATTVNLAVNASQVAVGATAYALAPAGQEVLGLTLGHATSFAVGLAVCSRVLTRRTGSLRDEHLVRTGVRCLAAGLPPALAATAVVLAGQGLLGRGPLAGAVVAAAGGVVLVGGYLALVRRMRVPEVDQVAGPVLRRVGLAAGSSSGRGRPNTDG